MTSSNTLKKLVSIGASLLLAVGSSLVGATPAQAAPTVELGIGSGASVTNMRWLEGASSPTNMRLRVTQDSTVNSISKIEVSMTDASNHILTPNGSTGVNQSNNCKVNDINVTSSTNVVTFITGGCVVASDKITYGSSTPFNLVAADKLSFNYLSGAWSGANKPAGTYYILIRYLDSSDGEISTASGSFELAVYPNITNPRGNTDGRVGTLLTTPGYTTVGLTAPVVYTTQSTLPAGLTLDATDGSIDGTPTATALNQPIFITATDANGITTTTVTTLNVGAAQNNGGGIVPPSCNPPITITSIGWSAASIGPSDTVRFIYNNDPSIGSSTLCFATAVDMSILSTLNGVVVGTPVRYQSYGRAVSNSTVTLANLLGGSTLSSQTVRDGDVYTTHYYQALGRVPTLADTPTFSVSIVLNPGGGSQGSITTALNAEQARNVLKPVPAAVQPLVPGFLALNKPMASLGGKVALSAGDFTGLVSAKIAGKSLDFILGKTGQITMTVPQGEAGKTADLLLTFNTGSIILQDAIKYVAPVDVAKVGVRPIAIAAGASKLSEEAADQIRHAALANLKNTDITCVAYAVADTAAAKAAAKATATKACALAKKTNSDLTVAPITVVVDKLKARTQGVGIKVYKADN